MVPARKVVVGSGINENRRNTSRAAFGTNQGGWFPRITALQNIWLKLELIFSTFQPSMYVLKRLAVYSAGRRIPTQHSLEVSVQSKFNSQCYFLEF
jgi:hypothetical protein